MKPNEIRTAHTVKERSGGGRGGGKGRGINPSSKLAAHIPSSRPRWMFKGFDDYTECWSPAGIVLARSSVCGINVGQLHLTYTTFTEQGHASFLDSYHTSYEETCRKIVGKDTNHSKPKHNIHKTHDSNNLLWQRYLLDYFWSKSTT